MMMSLGEIDINARGYMRGTPFTMAAALGLAATVKLFLDSGKVDAGSYADDNSSALMLAISRSHDDIAKMLLVQDGVDVNHANNYGHRALSLAAEQGLLDYRKTLARAVYAQRLPIIELLLDSGLIDINEVDERGRTALHHACGLHAEEVVEYLLQREGINANVGDDKGFTPLMVAAASSRGLPTVKILLQSGKVDIALQSHDGATAISIAHTKRRNHTFQLLEKWDRRSKGE
ncbi:hypothetical protein V2G26_009470 [Clonostachys chloroleuca]